jgi:uncharacterized membrane protein
MTKKLAMFFGTLFVLIGLLGFVANPIVGRTGYFVTNQAHDLAHIVIGTVLLLMASRGQHAAKLALWGTGGVYLLLALLGFAQIGTSGNGMLLDLVHINHHDNWLHVFLGAVLIISGLAKQSRLHAVGFR